MSHFGAPRRPLSSNLDNFHVILHTIGAVVPFSNDVVIICDAFCERFQVGEIRATGTPSGISPLYPLTGHLDHLTGQ